MWNKPSTPVETEDSEASLTNQTQFGIEKPLFEEPPRFVDTSPKAANAQTAKKKPSPLPFIAVGVIFILLLTVLALAVLKKQTTTIYQPLVSPTPVVTQNQDAYLARIEELRQDFRAADPAQTTLPFPPVSLSITLDPSSR
jgi:hypothetical protein